MVHISRKFQNEQPLAWDSFKRLIGLAMVGERECIKKALNNILTVHSFFAYFFSLVWVPHCPHSASTYLFVLIYSKVLQPWCRSGVSINWVFKICIFFNSKKKQKKEIKNKNKKHKKRGKKEKRKRAKKLLWRYTYFVDILPFLRDLSFSLIHDHCSIHFTHLFL